MEYNSLLLLLGAVGSTLIVVRGSIFSPIREIGHSKWQEFINCAQCTGFWVGFIFFAISFRASPLNIDWVLQGVIYGAVTSLFALVLDTIITYLKVKTRTMVKIDSISDKQ